MSSDDLIPDEALADTSAVAENHSGESSDLIPTESLSGTPTVRKRMPDGSLYTGAPWQDAILRAYNPPGEDTAVGVIGKKLGQGMISLGGQIVAGYAGLGRALYGLEKGEEHPLEDAADTVSKVQQATAPTPDNPNATVGPALAAQFMEHPANPMNWPSDIGQGATALLNKAGAAPEVSQGVGQAISQAGPLALGLIRTGGTSATPGPRIEPTLEDENTIPLGSPMTRNSQSVSAAASGPDVSRLSPELQEAYSKLDPNEVNQEVLARHAEADSLPVKMRLSEGQATQDPDIVSREENMRGATGFSDFKNQQGRQLKDNLTAIRDEVGPDVFSTNPVEHGDTLIQAYKDKDAPVVADIQQKYQALKDAAAQFPDSPIDGQALANNARIALKKGLKSNFLNPGLASDLNRWAEGEPMSFEDLEAFKTNLANEQRSASDGNARAAAGIVRQEVENLPLKGNAAALQPLANAARNAARARFQALDADPAYDAAVNGTVSPDQFVRKFITGGSATRDGVALMRRNLAGNDTALQTMGVAAVDELRNAAGVDGQGNGSFGPARYNARLQSLSPKLNTLLPPEAAEHAQALGNVARYVKQAPEGNTVNRSNTLSGAIAQGAGHLARSVVNVHTGGIGGPVIDYAAAKLGERALKNELKNATAPLAGATYRGASATVQ